MSNGKTLAGSHKSLDLAALFGASSAALTSAAASICCAGPWALALLGVNGAIIGAGIKPYRIYLLAASVPLLAYAYWRLQACRRASVAGEACATQVRPAQRITLWIAIGLWIGAIVIGLAADRYWL